MTKHKRMTYGEAVKDPSTRLGRWSAAQSRLVAQRKDWTEAQWVAFFSQQRKET